MPNEPQVLSLTSAQVDAAYMYFEEPFNGRAQPDWPDGVVKGQSFSATMGRGFADVWADEGHS